jgi:hypothetical protein
MSDATNNRFYREADEDGCATDYEKAYFERGMFAAYAWMTTRKRGEQLSDAVVEHAWANRDAGMGPTECLPTRSSQDAVP